MPIHFRKRGNALVALSPEDERSLDKIADGVGVEATPKPIDERRDRFLRRLFMIANHLLKKDAKHFDDASDMIDACKMKLGMVKPGHHLTGKFYARVISSRDMTFEEVADLHDGALVELTALYGFDVNTILPPLAGREENPGGETPIPPRSGSSTSGGADPSRETERPLPNHSEKQPPPEEKPASKDGRLEGEPATGHSPVGSSSTTELPPDPDAPEPTRERRDGVKETLAEEMVRKMMALAIDPNFDKNETAVLAARNIDWIKERPDDDRWRKFCNLVLEHAVLVRHGVPVEGTRTYLLNKIKELR